MAKTVLFIKATTKPGKRDELRQLWEQYLKPHIETNQEEEICFYCYGANDENTICMFEFFSESYDLRTAFQSDWFKAYMEAASHILAGPPEVITTTPIWAKGAKL